MMPELTRRESWALLRDALEAMEVKELECDAYYPNGWEECGCALGEMARFLDPDRAEDEAESDSMIGDLLTDLGVNEDSKQAIVYANDKEGPDDETPPARWARMHALAVREADAEEVCHG